MNLRADALRSAVILGLGLAAVGVGCAGQSSGTGGSGGSATTTATSTGGAGGGTSLCKQDCTQFAPPQCYKSVCNEGQYPGTVGECVVVPGDKGAACDDGLFCTVMDACDDKGQCKGGAPNDCGMSPPPCTDLTCDETSKTCSTAPSQEGAPCVATDLCLVNTTCQSGQCKGTPRDCSFSPYTECNTVACNPTTGLCDATPDATKNGTMCGLSGDICSTGKTCMAGQCAGGTPKDCSALTQGCVNGVCDANSGSCTTMPVPMGGMCAAATDQCNQGICNMNGVCQAMPLANGTACNDHKSCTSNDTCNNGTCSGTSMTGCLAYFEEGFEACPGGWVMTGDWQCGTPSVSGPSPHTGVGVMATVLNGDYHASQSYTTTTAISQDIDLSTATAPKILLWVWTKTESSLDGANLKIAQDGSATYTLVPVTPAYDGTVNSENAWTGDHSAQGWRPFTADLTAYAGHHVKLELAFRSDSSIQYPGVYVDDVTVAEPVAIPLSITTPSLPKAIVGQPYAVNLARFGGTAGATWSITGGTNDAWLTINPATGALSGTPTMAAMGPVSVTIKVSEPTYPSNQDIRTYNFNVGQGIYSQSFEGTCASNGWTLTGDWQCGTPSAVGPAMAASGAQCLGTVLNGNYNLNDAYATTTATSPGISLVGANAPTLTFQAWVYTEGSTYDGFNVKVSTDGTNYTTLTTVTPVYPLTIASEPAWGGDQSAMGWQTYTADLSAFIGQTVNLRFAFRSDGSIVDPGVYIDDVLVSN